MQQPCSPTDNETGLARELGLEGGSERMPIVRQSLRAGAPKEGPRDRFRLRFRRGSRQARASSIPQEDGPGQSFLELSFAAGAAAGQIHFHIGVVGAVHQDGAVAEQAEGNRPHGRSGVGRLRDPHGESLGHGRSGPQAYYRCELDEPPQDYGEHEQHRDPLGRLQHGPVKGRVRT